MKNWIYTLDVVRTGRSMVQDLENRCYACPWTKGNYSHKRSKYIGLLEEDGVVDITFSNNKYNFIIEYNNIGNTQRLEQRAKEILANSNFYGHQMLQGGPGMRLFILSEITVLDNGCEKDSFGGMLPGKIYLYLPECSNILDVKRVIDGKVWSMFR